jgi:hypothetical protein
LIRSRRAIGRAKAFADNDLAAEQLPRLAFIIDYRDRQAANVASLTEARRCYCRSGHFSSWRHRWPLCSAGHDVARIDSEMSAGDLLSSVLNR